MLLLLATLAAVNVLAYAWLLVNSDLVPYVTDNNESFSAFAHAANMFVFGIANSAALLRRRRLAANISAIRLSWANLAPPRAKVLTQSASG